MNAKQLSNIVQKTPSGLHEAYGREIETISCFDEADRDRALLILFWVLIAERPLTVRELSEALLIHIESLAFPDEDLPDTWDRFYVDDRIRKLCGSLVEVRCLSMDQPIADQSVHFLHSSVREYLLDPKQSPTWVANEIRFSHIEGLHYYAARIYLRYLCLPEVTRASPFHPEFWLNAQRYALLEYAVREWHVHAHKSGNFSKKIVPFVNDFFDAEHDGWLLWAKLSECLDEAMVSDYGEAIEQGRRSPRYRAKPVATPLYYAALLGFTETVQFLHSNGAALNVEGAKFGSAINAAAAGSHISVVEYLIEHGASVQIHNKMSYTALGIAASHWGCKLVFPHGPYPCPSVVDRIEKTRKVMKILVDAGVDVNHRNSLGSTALHSVATMGNVDGLDFLLDHGACIDSTECDGTTPVRWAMQCGLVENAEHLLRRGADVHGTTSGESDLIHACRWGYGTVVDLLLKGGADSMQIFRGRKPLHWAAEEDSTLAIITLINHGAVPDEVEKPMGRTSLSLAAASGRSANVEVLLCNPSKLGHTRLARANGVTFGRYRTSATHR